MKFHKQVASYSPGLFVTLLVGTLLMASSVGFSQDAAKTPPVRDAKALEIIQDSLTAMSTAQSAEIHDYTITGVIEEEHGYAGSSPISIAGIGSSITSAKLTLHSGQSCLKGH